MAEEDTKKPIELDDVTKERWIKQMKEDFPHADNLMCELVISQWCADPDYFDKLKRGEETLPPPIERNTEYSYNGITVE